jgi:hypothetical protein
MGFSPHDASTKYRKAGVEVDLFKRALVHQPRSTIPASPSHSSRDSRRSAFFSLFILSFDFALAARFIRAKVQSMDQSKWNVIASQG